MEMAKNKYQQKKFVKKVRRMGQETEIGEKERERESI